MSGQGHNSGDVGGIAADRLKSFIERIEDIDASIHARRAEQRGLLAAFAMEHPLSCAVSPTGRRVANPILRFLDLAETDDEGCWPWAGTITRNGYGFFHVDGAPVLAHRWAFKTFRGPISEGLVLDHLCRRPKCVNPFHLEPVTQAENVRRGVSIETTRRRMVAKTHCPHGHPYSGSNLYVIPGSGARTCRECSRLRRRVYQSKRSGR